MTDPVSDVQLPGLQRLRRSMLGSEWVRAACGSGRLLVTARHGIMNDPLSSVQLIDVLRSGLQRLRRSVCGKAMLFRPLHFSFAATPRLRRQSRVNYFEPLRKSIAFPHIDGHSPKRNPKPHIGARSPKLIILAAAIFLTSCGGYPTGTVVFVTNERAGTISVIDAQKDTVIDTIQTGGRPRGIRLSADGARAYVAISAPFNDQQASGFDKIIVVDTTTGNIERSIDVGTDPEQLAVDRTENFLYVSNEDAGTATVVDLETGEAVAVLVTGIEPEGVAISPDDRWVYVMAETSSTVTVIDTSTHTVARTFLVGERPRDAAFSPDGRRAYISSELGHDLSVVEIPSHTVISLVPLGLNDTERPVGVVVSPDARTIYVANGRGDSVSVIDVETLQMYNTIPVGSRVWGIGLTGDGRKLYAANGLSNDISVIDTATGKVIKTIPAGDGPWGVAVRRSE